MRAQLDQARSLVAGRPPSRIQAGVLEQSARYAMLADRNEEAIATGREALRMAQELGLDDVRARVFNNIGSARVASGDPGGVEDLDKSIAISERINLADEMVRRYNNRGTMKLLLGRIANGKADVREARRLAAHFGHRGFVRWSEAGPLFGDLWNDGKWDEIVERADAFVEQFGAEAHYQAAGAHIFRGFVRAGRGDDAGAADDAARAWEVARPIGDPQVAGNTLLASTFTFMVIGASDRAAKMFDEALELFGECRSSDGSSLSCTPSRGWAGSSGAARMYWPR